jgi:protein translocase SecG subunit
LKSFSIAAAQKTAAPSAVHAPAHAATIPSHATLPSSVPFTPPPAPVASPPPTFFQAHASWFTHSIAGIFVAAALGLIVLLAVQTTKQEGLSGTIGGRVESAYHGRLGAEEQLKRITGWVAVAFVVCGFILSLTGI